MMERTDRHFRFLMRLITKRTLLYTEMVTAGAILHGNRDQLLEFDDSEHPVSLQLGGDDPAQLRDSIRLAEPYGYDEYDLNVGCPSDRVQNANFGACLMARPDHARRLVEAMKDATNRPVTVKHRIGIRGRESFEQLVEFVRTVNEAGPARFSVHARIAILEGLSPKDNRNVPPLRYEDVYALKREFPGVPIVINGGIETLDAVEEHLTRVDGVMIGRAAYDHPWLFRDVDRRFFGDNGPPATRREVLDRYSPYIDHWQQQGRSLHGLLRPILGLFSFEPGTRRFKQRLSGRLDPSLAASVLVARAIEHLTDEVLDG
jgi:tRNA-dihydrouridine synthase A